MSRYLLLLLALAPLAGAGCAASEAHASTNQPAAPDPQSTCVQVFQRARACTDAFIPALVDSRARTNRPAGIADAVRADRDGVIAQAKTEWATDSTDDAIAGNCHQLAGVADPGQVDTAAGCLAQADCAGFTSCVIPVFEKHFAK